MNELKDLEGFIKELKRNEPDPDKEYYLFKNGINSDKGYNRVVSPSIGQQKKLDVIRLKRATLPDKAKEQICKEMGFAESDIGENYSDIEYIQRALPIVIIDLPKKYNVDDLSSKIAKEAINDFLLDT